LRVAALIAARNADCIGSDAAKSANGGDARLRSHGASSGPAG
jgi:hypothetical protein